VVHCGAKSEELSRIDLLDRLSAEERRALLGIATLRRYKPPEVICEKGDPGSDLFAIIHGRLKAVTTSAEGKCLTLAIMGPGELFGEIAVLDDAPRTATVLAIEPCELLRFSRRDFLALLQQNPSMAVKLLSALAAKMRRLSDLVDEALFLDLSHRLARKLLALSALYGTHTDRGVRIDLKFTQRELGELVGVSRESINKQLRTWTEEGILGTEDGHLNIVRSETLEWLADPLHRSEAPKKQTTRAASR
jgi:CRP-like cAMP-binding protein